MRLKYSDLELWQFFKIYKTELASFLCYNLFEYEFLRTIFEEKDKNSEILKIVLKLLIIYKWFFLTKKAYNIINLFYTKLYHSLKKKWKVSIQTI